MTNQTSKNQQYLAPNWLGQIGIIYLITLLADLLFIATDQPHLRWISKPLLMVILIIGLILIRNGLKIRYFILWMAALVFSWLGDIFLLLDESFFIPGLLAFLCSHISYILLFYKIQTTSPLKKNPFVITIILTIAYFIFFYQIILLETGSLFPAVLIYALVILAMWLVASYKALRQSQLNLWLWIGALLFVVSDSLLGYNKFVQFIPVIGGLVMLTYGIAQYGLFRGIIQATNAET